MFERILKRIREKIGNDKVEMIVKFSPTGKLVVITVYLLYKEEEA
jgi:hypothetical protein